MSLVARAVALLLLSCAVVAAEPPKFLARERFEARDSLDAKTESESSEDARACLRGLVWKPKRFEVRCLKAARNRGDALVRFASPLPVGNPTNDLVAMEWYAARDKAGEIPRARAIVVVHESGSSMMVGRLFAAKLREQGLHAFLLQLPGYGERRGGGARATGEKFFPMIRQAIADVRRARDAVAALPNVDTAHIALQGTSLGGFVAATSAGLDPGFDSVFLTLAGGNLYDLIQHGQRDTAKVRQRLSEAGVTNEMLKQMAHRIEPTRLAHRVDPLRTWLFSGVSDTVVPMKNALALAKAARLTRNHHVRLPSNHYSGIIFLPSMCQLIARQVRTLPARKK